MVIIEEEEDDVQAKHSIMDSSSSLSSHHHPHHNRRPSSCSLPAAPAAHPSAAFPDSPDTVSSISSDHTFHGFSPIKDDLHSVSPSTSPPINPAGTRPASIHVPVSAVANRLVRDHPGSVTKTESEAETGFAEGGVGGDRGGGFGGRRVRQPLGVLRRARMEKIVKTVGLGLRVCEFVVCLVSFSVMAADKNLGWALDSFDRYVEFRFSLSVNVIGFAYSALQGLDLLHHLTTGKDLARSQLRYCIDFAIDQILAYLLLSASSSAFTRVDEWISNWGQDKFPAMASASVGVSFLAFIAFASSSLISGYILCSMYA